MAHWKGTEFGSFLNYAGVVVLKNFISDNDLLHGCELHNTEPFYEDLEDLTVDLNVFKVDSLHEFSSLKTFSMDDIFCWRE
ncbi:uncharacterized protein LOC131215655 [Anopheles bellator]|uniref:uncharacterized protein LOC131215655 n=1 Tax=Anopheles bellator TaxID=139047 RepID=UPI00264862AC|nr:uncharacterized protein LOC131215655 [Anopheles bellator]